MSFHPHFVELWVKKTFGILSKPQSENMALAVYGMTKKRTGIISDLVRDRLIPGSSKHKNRRKKFDRFLANYRVKPEILFKYWISWAFQVFTSGKYVPIAIDWTTLPGNRQCLMAAIPFLGRGIPLYWRILQSHESIKDSQNKIEERLLTRLLNMLPDKIRPIIIGDRGFGRAELADFLLKKGFYLSYGLGLM